MNPKYMLHIALGTLVFTATCKKEKKAAESSPSQSDASPVSPPTQVPTPTAAVKAIPDGYHTITPTIHVKDVDGAVAFYQKAFGAKKMFAMPSADGKSSMHAQVKFGDSILMIGREHEGQSYSPETAGGVAGSINIQSEDASAMAKIAVDAGATEIMAVSLQFWGDDWGMLIDPFGHVWSVSTHKIDVPGDKMADLAAVAMKNMKSKKNKPLNLPGEAAKSWKNEGWPILVPTIHLNDAETTLSFYEKAFGAEIKNIMKMPKSEKLMHAELKIGDSIVVVSDAMPEMGSKSPSDLGGKNPMGLYVYVEDADKAHKKALAAAGTEVFPVMEMFWGDRLGFLLDPSGHGWSMATHTKDLTPEQMMDGMKKQMSAFADMKKGNMPEDKKME